MKTIGLTGGIGAGKSAASRILAELGALVIDADRVGHEVYLPGTPGWEQVVAAFGGEIVAPDGTIDRRQLGTRVFAAPAELARLNAIVHPLIRDAVAARVAAARAGNRPIVVEAALLVEAKWDALVDEVWLVTARPDVIEARLVEQRGMTPEAIAARVRAQLSDAERAARADVIIDNSSTPAALRAEIERLWRERLAPA
ncbi:MAG: dephospho-CoA kinase [Deltaproteobacteria bacterium]|nr:dephospho-CoA kinase [Deltaproteobacteria bacterium]